MFFVSPDYKTSIFQFPEQYSFLYSFLSFPFFNYSFLNFFFSSLWSSLSSEANQANPLHSPTSTNPQPTTGHPPQTHNPTLTTPPQTQAPAILSLQPLFRPSSFLLIFAQTQPKISRFSSNPNCISFDFCSDPNFISFDFCSDRNPKSQGFPLILLHRFSQNLQPNNNNNNNIDGYGIRIGRRRTEALRASMEVCR